MPNHETDTDTNNEALDRLIAGVVERVQLDLIDDLVKGEGPAHELLLVSTQGRAEQRGEALARIKQRLGELAATSHLENTRHTAATLLRDARAPLRKLPRAPIPTSEPQPEAEAEAEARSASWRFTQLRVDWIRCIRDTIEVGRDEMYLVGSIIPVSAPKRRRAIDFHLGDFRRGDREDYNGTRVVQYAYLGGVEFPTRVACLLSVVEKDKVGPFKRMLDRLLDYIDEAIVEQSGEGGPPDWWKVVKECIERVIDFLLGWIGRPEILRYDGKPVFRYESPTIKSVADSWPADHKSNSKDFLVKGHGGKYELRLLFQRSRTSYGT